MVHGRRISDKMEVQVSQLKLPALQMCRHRVGGLNGSIMTG